jgi:Alpha galactosidase C-terminal beta sandwich domain/Alpha galactosidase A
MAATMASRCRRETQLSLWALASSPLILGTDLTNLDPTDLSLLENAAVIAVDQDAIDASGVAETSSSQVFAKTEKNGDVIVGLFNTSSQPETVSTTASALGLPGGYTGYRLDDLWAGTSTETARTIEAGVAPEGAAPDYVPGGGPRFTFGAIVFVRSPQRRG